MTFQQVKNCLLLLTCLLAPMFGTGCVLGRRTVDLTLAPMSESGTAPANSRNVALGPITDERAFQNKPPDPSIPSIDGDVNKVSRDELKGMIGRQRNGYGGAAGDVALPEGQTVESKMFELVKSTLESRRHRVRQATGPTRGDSIQIKINQFWAWFTPGFAYVTFESRIQCVFDVTVNGRVQQIFVNGYGENKGQVASNANWQLAYTRAFDNFRANLDIELEKLGL